MALSVSGFPETSALSQDSEPSTTTTTIRSLFSSNSGNSLATKVSPATSKPTNSHISKEEFQQIHDTAQVPLHPPEHLPSVPRPRQVSLTSAGTRRTPPPTASGVRQQYQQLQQRLDLPTNNPPAARSLPGMQPGTHSTHHGLPQPPTVKVHHDWATNSSTAGVSFSSTSSPRPLPTIPMPMPGLNSMATGSSTNSGPIVESSKKAEARAATVPGTSTTQAGPSTSSPPGPSSVSVGSPAAASSSARVSTSPSTSRTMPIRTTSSEVVAAASSSLAGPASAIPVSTSPPTVSSPQLPPLNLSMNRRRAQTTAPITHPLPTPQNAAGPNMTRLQSVTTAADLVESPLSASIPISAIPPAPSQPPPAVPTQSVAGPRPLPRIPPAGGPSLSTPILGASTLPVASSSKAGAAVGLTYVSGSKTVTTIIAGGSGSSAASSSSSSSSSVAGPSTPKKGSMKVKRPRTSPGPEASGNNLAALLASGSNAASGSGLGPNLSRSGSITRSMASSSTSHTNNGLGPSGSSLSITTSILKRTTSPPVSGATPILTSSSTSSSSTRSSPHKDTPPTTGPSAVSLNPILKSLPSTSTPPVAGSSNINAPPASAPIVPTSGMPPRSRSQSRTRTRVTLPPSPPSHTTGNGQTSSSLQPARRTLQLHQPVPVASSSWGAAAVTVGASGSGRVTSPPLPTGSISTPSGSAGPSVASTHPSLPPIPGSSLMRRGSATAAAIITGNSSTHTPATTPPTTPGPSRSKPLPSAYGSKHSSTLSSGGAGIPLGQASSMPSIGGGRFSSQSHGHGHSHGPLPPRPGGAGAATAAAMLYAAVPCPISPNNANATAGGSKAHSRSNSHTQSQMISGKPTSNVSNSNSRSASLSRETSHPSLATVAAAGASRSASRSNSKSRANSINTTAPNLPSISTTVGGRPSYKPASVASPASSPRLGFAPQPAFITASSPITGMSHSAVSSPVSPDKSSESPFNASRATSPLGAVAAGSRATSPLGARARVRTTSPAGQRLFASSLARKAKAKEWGSDEEDIEPEDGGRTKERGEWLYGAGASMPGAGTTSARSSSVTSNAARPKQVADIAKEREERRVHMQKEERRMAERKKREEKRQEEKAKVKTSSTGRQERYRDEEDEPMHEHPTLGRMSSDSELGGAQVGRKRMSMVGNGSRGLDNGELRLMGDGEAFVNDEDYDPILSRSPSPMQYARPGSRSSFSSSIGSSFEQGHTNALAQGLDDDDDDAGYHRARNRNRGQRRNGASVDKTRAAQLLSYRRSYRGPTGPDELSDARPHRSGSASSGRGIASPSPRIHSASPSSSLRHLEGMAGHWKPGIDIGDAEMLEEQELDRSPSPIRYARRNSLEASAIEMIELEQDLAEAQGGPEKGRRGTLRAKGHSTDLTIREDTKDALEDYGYGYGGGFERQTDILEKSAWSDGETLHDKPKKSKKKTKTKADDKRTQQSKPSQLESTLATVGAVLGMGDGDKSPKKDKKDKDRAKAKKEKRKKTDTDGDQTATFGTSSSGSLRTSRGGSSYSNNFAQSVSTLSGSVIDISSLPPTPPQPANGQPATSKLQEVSMKMQVLGPSGRRGSKEDIGGSLKRLRTYTFDSYEPSSVLGGNPVANIAVSRSKTDFKTHKRRSYSQGQIEAEQADDPTDPWGSHWVSKLTQTTSGTNSSSQTSPDNLTNKAAPPPPEFQPMRKTDSPVSFDAHQRALPSAWTSRKNDSGDTSSTDTARSRKTSGASTTRSAANLAKSLKFGPSVPVERKAGRGGGVWVKNSSGSSLQ